MKKAYNILIIFIVIVSISLPVLGEETVKLDLITAIQYAQENNLDLKLAELNLKRARLEYQRGKANNLLQQSHYSDLQAEHSLAAAENTYQNTINSIVNDTIDQYTSLYLADLDLLIKEKQLEKEEKALADARAQYQIGDIGNIALLEAENAYKDVQFSLDSAKDSYQQTIREFKNTLGLQGELPELVILIEAGVWEVEEETAVETALDNSINLKLTADELGLARIDLERAGVSASRIDIELKEIALKTAKIELTRDREELRGSTQNTFYQFKQAAKNMELAKEGLSESTSKYELIKKQYEMGLGTKSDLMQYEINNLQAEYQYQSAIANYYLREQALRQAMNLETGVFEYENAAEK